MITADTLEEFPLCPAYGFSVDPNILVKLVSRDGGFVRADRKWQHPLREFNGTPIGNRYERDIEQILHFFLAVGGTSGLFRFKDYTDYKSSFIDEEPTAIDQPIVTTGESPTTYRLQKNYTFGALTYERPIYRPIGSTIRVANQLGVEQVASRWTINEATGILTPGGAFVGTPTTWGGQFVVKARFSGSFVPEIVDKQIQRADVSVVEVRELT